MIHDLDPTTSVTGMESSNELLDLFDLAQGYTSTCLSYIPLSPTYHHGSISIRREKYQAKQWLQPFTS